MVKNTQHNMKTRHLILLAGVLLLIGLLAASCNDSGPDQQTPGGGGPKPGDTIHIQKQVIVRHDTLVIICTKDSVKLDTSAFLVFGDGGGYGGTSISRTAGTITFFPLTGGYETTPQPFSNGKTKDTIYKHEIIYY